MPKITEEIELNTAEECFRYAYNKRLRLPKQLEKIISKDAEYSLYYAKVLKNRFELGEPAIATNANYSYYYCIDVLKPLGIIGFPLGEKEMAKDPAIALNYSRYVLEGRFKLGEETMAKDDYFAAFYATDAIKDRFELGEKAIFNSCYEHNYLEFLKEKGYSVQKKITINKKKILDKVFDLCKYN